MSLLGLIEKQQFYIENIGEREGVKRTGNVGAGVGSERGSERGS